MQRTDCHLWIDADDTLWETQRLFEEVFEQFVALTNRPDMTALEIRDVLDEIEHVNNRIYGYGAISFVRNLRQCLTKLAERELEAHETHALAGWEEELVNFHPCLFEGVSDTLLYLSERHELMLCTKGDPDEQRRKVERSGLAGHFDHIHVVKEKDKATYLTLAAQRKVATEKTWMIGNSPKSDINPVLAAGLGAVYIPHSRTWHLEHEEIPEGHERLLILSRFDQLREHF